MTTGIRMTPGEASWDGPHEGVSTERLEEVRAAIQAAGVPLGRTTVWVAPVGAEMPADTLAWGAPWPGPWREVGVIGPEPPPWYRDEGERGATICERVLWGEQERPAMAVVESFLTRLMMLAPTSGIW